MRAVTVSCAPLRFQVFPVSVGIVLLSLLVTLFFVVPQALAEPADEQQRKIWAQASDEVEDVAELRIEDGFSGWKKGENARARRLAVLLDEAVDRISDGEARQARERLAAIAEERRRLSEEIAEARMDEAGSGPNAISGLLAMVGMAPADTIAAKEQRLKDLEVEAVEARGRLVNSLRAAGVELSDGQIDGILMLATGDRLVDMMAAFANLKSIELELRRVVEASGESATSARRYYGLHATLAETALWMQNAFIDDIDSRYLPELDRIEAEAERLIREARGLMGSGGADHDILSANLAAQQLTLKTAKIYRQELARQKAAMSAAASRTAREFKIAVNTWKTVKVSTDLVAMTRSVDGDFKGLLDLQLPDLRPFGGVELKAEFERITGRLAAAPSS